jgi:ketosteroid isomerase-like protein
MLPDPVQTSRALIELWNARDRPLARMCEFFDPAIELHSPLSSVAGEPYRGYAGIEQWLRDVDEQFARWSVAADDVRQVGEQVVVIGTASALGRASAVPLRFPMASVHDFARDGRLARVRIYPDVDEALEALGRAHERPRGA